jgi:hypothetical protein
MHLSLRHFEVFALALFFLPAGVYALVAKRAPKSSVASTKVPKLPWLLVLSLAFGLAGFPYIADSSFFFRYRSGSFLILFGLLLTAVSICRKRPIALAYVLMMWMGAVILLLALGK